MSIGPTIVEAPSEVFESATLAGSSELFSEAARSTSARHIALLEIGDSGGDPSADTVFSTHRFCSRPEDAIAPNLFYRPLIKQGLQVARSLVDGDRIRGLAQQDTCSMVLLNGPGELAAITPDGPDSVVDVGAVAEVWLTGDSWPRTQRKRIFRGVLADLTPASDSRSAVVSLNSCAFDLKRPIQIERFRGLGQALGFREAEDDTLTLPFFAAMSQPVLTYEVFCKLRALPGAANFGLGGRSDTFRLWIGTAHHINARVIDSAATQTNCTSTETVTVDDEYHLISMRWDGATLDVFLDGVLIETAAIGGGFTTLNTTAVTDFVLGFASGYNAPDADVAECRLWRTARTNAEIFENSGRGLADPDHADLVFYLKMNEGLGAETFDDERDKSATVATDVPWVSTYTGDAELGGKLMPTSWGFVWHRDTVPVDTQAKFYQVHQRAVKSIDRVYEGGRALIPDYTTTSSLAEYSAVTNRIQGGNFDFRPFVRGQKITISTGLNAGDWTVQSVDEVKGLWCRVYEPLSDGVEAVLAGIDISTLTGTAEFTQQFDRGGFTLNATPSKEITCRVRGDLDPVDGYVDDCAGLIKRIGKVALGMTDADFSPGFDEVASAWPIACGWATSGDSEMSVEELWSKLAQGIGANVSDVDGEVDIALFLPPPELDLSSESDNRLDLDRTNLLAIDRLRTMAPIEKAVVHYRPNFRPMSDDELVDEVKEPVDAWGIKHLHELRNSFLSVEYSGTAPNATPGMLASADVLESAMIGPAWSMVLAKRNFELYGVQREVFMVRTINQPYQYDLKRCSVTIVHPNWATVESGKSFRMLRLSGGRFGTELGVWG